MSTKLIAFAAALIAAGPVFAAVGTSSGGSSSAGSSSAVSAHFGGGGHVGGSGGGGGRSAASGLGGRGAALASRGNLANHGNVANHGIHANALHATNSIAGKHAPVESTSKIAGMDHHHYHPFRHEPRYRENRFPQYFESCAQMPDDPFRPWLCSGATKSFTGTKRQS
jgi:hypothetical protein